MLRPAFPRQQVVALTWNPLPRAGQDGPRGLPEGTYRPIGVRADLLAYALSWHFLMQTRSAANLSLFKFQMNVCGTQQHLKSLEAHQSTGIKRCDGFHYKRKKKKHKYSPTYHTVEIAVTYNWGLLSFILFFSSSSPFLAGVGSPLPALMRTQPLSWQVTESIRHFPQWEQWWKKIHVGVHFSNGTLVITGLDGQGETYQNYCLAWCQWLAVLTNPRCLFFF